MQVLILTKMQVIQKKRNKIADFYIKSAQLEGSNEEIANQLDEIVEDALSDYVSNNKNPFDTK